MMQILGESREQQERFRIIANKLLNNCFILKKKDETRNDYMFIQQNQSMFDEYFLPIGYKIDLNTNFGVVALINTSGHGRMRLKKSESIILLLLRLLYIEKSKELRLTDDVVIAAEEIHDKYGMLKLRTKPMLDKTTLRDCTNLFKRYNLIATLDRDVTVPSARIIIYPTILFAIPGDNLTGLYDSISEKLTKYVNGGEVNEPDQDNEEDADQD